MWLAGAQGTDHGLVFPGRPTRSTADLCLGPDHVELRAFGAVAVLGWEASDRSWTLRPWGSSFWPTSRDDADWTALYAKGEAVNAVVPVLNALAAHTHRFTSRNPMEHALENGPIVPLHRPYVGTMNGKAWERASVWALCRLLATRPELRPRLMEGDRMKRLVDQMAASAVLWTPTNTSLRRTSMEILTAMRGAHLTHPIGDRPVPGDRLVARNEAVQLVMARLARNPYAKGVEVTPAQVGALLDSHYYEVKPWPLGDLVE
jgi:hypothetical protein